MCSLKVKSKENLDFKKARDYAFRLLKFRMRSEKELQQRLKKRKFEPETIDEVIAFLREKGFVDDKEFSRAWVEYKLKKPLGIRRIKEELKIKGITQKIIEEVLIKLKTGYDEESIVLGLAQARLKRLQGIEPMKAKARLYAWLLRRGFSPDVVSDVISQL